MHSRNPRWLSWPSCLLLCSCACPGLASEWLRAGLLSVCSQVPWAPCEPFGGSAWSAHLPLPTSPAGGSPSSCCPVPVALPEFSIGWCCAVLCMCQHSEAPHGSAHGPWGSLRLLLGVWRPLKTEKFVSRRLRYIIHAHLQVREMANCKACGSCLRITVNICVKWLLDFFIRCSCIIDHIKIEICVVAVYVFCA